MALPSLRSVSAVVAAARGVLPPELVSAPSYERLLALAPHLPDSILVGLECRLGERDEAVDLWICPGLTSEQLQPAAAWLRGQGWPDFAPLSGCLERQAPPWPCAWGAWTTEFDLAGWDSQSAAPPLPSSFVTFGSAQPPLDIEAVVSGLWEGERGTPFPHRSLELLRALLKRCPRGELAGWGFLDPRKQQPARLMLRVSAPEDLAGLLGPRLDTARRLLDGLTYQIVIGTALEPESEKRQSLEAYLQGPQAWTELSRRLTAQGYSTPGKAEALLRLALEPPIHSEIIGTLNHVKMAICDDGRAEVKAYPSLFPRA